MLNFESDYIAGAHPALLKRLIETNLEQQSGYGYDDYQEPAKQKIREAIACPGAQISFLTGGTQTNACVIGTMLNEWEGVIAAKTGHINVHEAGAIEYGGHKVIELPAHDFGKLQASDVRRYMELFYADGNREHMTFPGMVYISHPTEYGTLYSKRELEELHAVCSEYKIPLYLDGARLFYALKSAGTDVTMKDIAELTDVFYIGGTKVGALCGEAVVFTRGNMPIHFEGRIKKRGALLEKGRLLSLQFDAFFTDDLYLKISEHVCRLTERMNAVLHRKGYTFFLESPTNQQFVILENEEMKKLGEKVKFGFWETYDAAHTVVRFACAWSTTEEDIDELEKILQQE